MTAGIIIYFLITATVLLFDGVWVFMHAKASEKPILECNFIRYVRPLQLLLCMFAITMLELVVQYFGLITKGFVDNTTIFLGVFSAIYILDFIVKEVKLKSYKFIIIKTNKVEFKQLTEAFIVKTHLDDSYMTGGDIQSVNSQEVQKANGKPLRAYLITRTVMAVFMLIAMIASVIAIAMGK